MKLATLKTATPDGELVVVSDDLTHAARVSGIAPTMQSALDRWGDVEPRLRDVAAKLEGGKSGIATVAFDPAAAMSPLPRSYFVFDASNYLRHHELMGRIFNKPVVGTTFTEPLGYQSGRGVLLGPRDDIVMPKNAEMWGMDFEAEVAVVTDRVPMGTSAEKAASHIKLVMLMNDISLRHLNLRELEKGFGLCISKPISAFSPVAVTPESLGKAWDGEHLHLPVVSTYNGTEFGRPNAGVGSLFGFPQLIAYCAQTRELGPGSIFGGGTVSNRDPAVGSSCITERRAIEIAKYGEPKTEFMSFGDNVQIEAFDSANRSVFGAIRQKVSRLS